MDVPVYRLFASAACIVVALALYAVVNRTRLGMMIRAGASNRDMVRGARRRHPASSTASSSPAASRSPRSPA